ncbi:MAG: hypothetical protein WD049_02325, partial [Candidatus Paceibacterota bacterium]
RSATYAASRLLSHSPTLPLSLSPCLLVSLSPFGIGANDREAVEDNGMNSVLRCCATDDTSCMVA